nr:hypothetical protein Iba_chr14aCG7060 [Ipomoea batatas]
MARRATCLLSVDFLEASTSKDAPMGSTSTMTRGGLQRIIVDTYSC